VVDPLDRLKQALADRYTIERELGRGGMATVYLARDLKHDRLVAVKVLRPALAAVLGGERFLREIRLTAQLQHPHILSLLDSGEAAGFLYYVMPYIEGESLRERLTRGGQLSVDETLRLTDQVAAALDYAHQRGVIHRDIKPENVLLYQGEAMVADFGVALGTPSLGAERLTETGLSLGTPTYMSPEQASADPKLDARSDQYSLACVVYEMLTGEPPYTAPTAQALVAKHLSAGIPSARTVRPDVPPHLDAAISRALSKPPAARFTTIAEFAQSLDRSSPKIGRHRRTALAALCLVIALLTLVGLQRWRRPDRLSSSASERPSVAVLPFTNLTRDPENEYFSDGITEDISSQLARIRDLKVIAHTSAMHYKGTAEPPGVIGKSLGVTSLLQGSVRRAGDRVLVTARLVEAGTGEQLWADEYDRELKDVFGIQRDIATRIVTSLRSTLSPEERSRLERVPTRDAEAYNLYLVGRYHFAKYTPTSWKRSIQYFEQAVARDSSFALAYAGIADAYVLLGSLAVLQPGEAFPQARRAAQRALSQDSSLAEAHASLGLITAAYDHNWSAAEVHFRRALTLSPNSVYAHMWYAAFFLSPLGRHDEAIAEMRRAATIDPVSLPVRFNMAYRYYLARRYDEAIAECHRALELDPNFPVHGVLGFSYAALKRYDVAVRELEAALPDTTVTSYAVLGYVYALAGRNADARSILSSVKARAARSYVIPLDFSIIYAALGERDEAFRWLRRAYEEHDPLLVFINVAAWYDTVRDDPRFAALVKDLGLTS
jgi:eukaryotic-like serine/threonine-protein kinase